MSQPTVTITELSNGLASLPAGQKIKAFVGPADSGSLDTPGAYSRISDITGTFGGGPTVETAAFHVNDTGLPALIVRTDETTAGSYGTIDVTAFTGTAAPATDVSTEPNDDYEAYIYFNTGGTTGTAGITYQWSLDDGRTLSPITALGTGLKITIPTSGGVAIDLTTAQTVVAGDIIRLRCNAPAPNNTELGTAMDALIASAVAFDEVILCFPIDATFFDTLETKVAALLAKGKEVFWCGNTRIPNDAEDEATYLSALTTIFSAKATDVGCLCAGAAEITSAVTSRKYRRPISFAVGSKLGKVSEEINIANPSGAHLLKGVSIRDTLGNPKHHDESANPGLDDARFTVLRTIEDVQGIYVNRPRLFSASGSDFELVPHRRVMNLARAALRQYFVRRLSLPVLVNATTGYILEGEALEIESGAKAVMRSVLLAKPKASGIDFTLSRTDNILSTKTLTGNAGVIPVGYSEFINFDLGFRNPVLQVLAA